MSVVLEMLQYPFMVRALVVGVLISICASLLGTSLVLKRYSMIGDSLSHVGFAALAVSYAFYLDPLVVSIPVTMGAAFLLLEVKESMRIKGTRRRHFFAAALWLWGFWSFLSPEG